MPLKLAFGVSPALAFLALAFLFYKVEQKLGHIDMCCIRLGLFIWGIGLWAALIAFAVKLIAGHWPSATVVAYVCFAITTIAFTEPLLKQFTPRWRH